MKIINNRVWYLRYEGEDTAKGGLGNDEIKFDDKQQAFINDLLKKERDKGATNAQKMATQVQETLQQKTLSDKQRKNLEDQLESLKSQYMTKEQRAAEETEKAAKEFKKTVEDLSSEKDSWQARFTESSIIREIQDAAIENDAIETETIVALLRPKAKLIEALDAAAKPTGNYNTIIKFDDVKDEKPITIEIGPKDVIKRMKTLPKYQHLFKTKAKGGLGGINNGGETGEIDWTKISEEDYAKERRRLGLGPQTQIQGKAK